MYIRGENKIYCYDWSTKETFLNDVLISKESMILKANDKYTFTARAFDQYNVEIIIDSNFIWTINGNRRIDSLGKYKASSNPVGNDTVIVSLSSSNGIVSDTSIIKLKKSKQLVAHRFFATTETDTLDLDCAASSGLPSYI